MNPDLLHIFSKAFYQANDGKVTFPKKFQFDQVNKIEFYTNGMRGGCTVRFILKQTDSGEWFLDLYAYDDYCSWHKRINEKGEITDLENYKGQFGRPIYSDDPERTAREHREIQEHNDKVYRILAEKGLET